MIVECSKCLEAQEYNPNILVHNFSSFATMKIIVKERIVELTGKEAQIEMLRQHIACCHPFNNKLYKDIKPIKKVEIEYEEFII